MARDRDRPVYLGGTPARLSAVLSRARAAHGPPPEVYSFHLGLDECREIALHTSTLRRRQRRAHLGLTDEDRYLFSYIKYLFIYFKHFRRRARLSQGR